MWYEIQLQIEAGELLALIKCINFFSQSVMNILQWAHTN